MYCVTSSQRHGPDPLHTAHIWEPNLRQVQHACVRKQALSAEWDETDARPVWTKCIPFRH